MRRKFRDGMKDYGEGHRTLQAALEYFAQVAKRPLRELDNAKLKKNSESEQKS